MQKKCKKICTCQKKAVPLHPLSFRSLLFDAQSRKCQCKLLNGVMVALQILVLSVWVRVLVEQQKESSRSPYLI